MEQFFCCLVIYSFKVFDLNFLTLFLLFSFVSFDLADFCTAFLIDVIEIVKSKICYNVIVFFILFYEQNRSTINATKLYSVYIKVYFL